MKHWMKAAVLMLAVVLSSPCQAQFSPRTAGPGTSVKAMPKRVQTLAEQQKGWAMQDVKTALAKIRFLPKTTGVSYKVQQAVTEYAPSDDGSEGYGREWTADGCEKSIKRAETRYGLPPYLLHAIALTESGRAGRPNPLAMNIGGRPYFARNIGDMKRMVAQFGGETSSIDVGCLQVNLKYHAGRFKDWRSLLVPGYNAEYAALYLVELHKRYGTWSGAVGAYHSRTPWKSANYACLISRTWSQIFGAQKAGCGANIDAMSNLMYQTQRS